MSSKNLFKFLSTCSCPTSCCIRYIYIRTLLFSILQNLQSIFYTLLLYKVYCFIEISSTDKSDNLTCEIIHDNLTCENYRFSNIAFLYKLSLFKDCPLYNKQKNTRVLGNTRFISRVEHDISLVRCAHS